jgi:hypothetical protein
MVFVPKTPYEPADTPLSATFFISLMDLPPFLRPELPVA